MTVLDIEHAVRVFGSGRLCVVAVDDVSLRVSAGEFVAVMGPSGSGKSTLLRLAGGLDRPTSGRVLLAGRDPAGLDEARLAEVLRREVGFVFQEANLLASLTAAENVAIALEMDGVRPKAAMTGARGLLDSLGLGSAAGRFPGQLSGGEQQRVAIARAVVGGRSLLLADEPTGALDALTGDDTGETNAGGTVYFPLPVLERLDGGPGTADSIWVSTASSQHAAIDRVTAAAAARLAAAGYAVSTTEIYVTEAQITAGENSLLAIVEILGTVVVAIMLMGLVSALSMGVIERTREVGILRCVGARARQIRRVFSAEAVVLAFVGWAFGVLLGWLIYEGLLALLLRNATLSLPQEFPPSIPLVTLAGVLVLTLLVIRGPLRRATRIRPATALRYQ